jgi:hypothetical protein
MSTQLPVLLVDDRGVWISDGDDAEPYGIEWGEIEVLSGERLDLMDSQCILLQLDPASGDSIELSDRSPGFADAVEAISRHLPEIAEDWFERIAALPVTADPIVVWERLPPQPV